MSIPVTPAHVIIMMSYSLQGLLLRLCRTKSLRFWPKKAWPKSVALEQMHSLAKISQHPCLLLKLIADWKDFFLTSFDSNLPLRSMHSSFPYAVPTPRTVYGWASISFVWIPPQLDFFSRRKRRGRYVLKFPCIFCAYTPYGWLVVAFICGVGGFCYSPLHDFLST